MSLVDGRLRAIRKILEEDYGKGDKIPETDLEEAIAEEAGYSRRTKNKYIDIYERRGILEQGEKDDGQQYILKKLLKEDKEKKEVDYNANRKNVTVTINEDAVEKADMIGLNKSDFFERKLIERVSKIETEIETAAQNMVDEEEDIPFIKDLILERAYRKSKKKEKRKELYKKHFGPFNDFACEQLRKTAFEVAEDIGVEEKPEGVQ